MDFHPVESLSESRGRRGRAGQYIVVLRPVTSARSHTRRRVNLFSEQLKKLFFHLREMLFVAGFHVAIDHGQKIIPDLTGFPESHPDIHSQFVRAL